jgi:hypothetical protein
MRALAQKRRMQRENKQFETDSELTRIEVGAFWGTNLSLVIGLFIMNDLKNLPPEFAWMVFSEAAWFGSSSS